MASVAEALAAGAVYTEDGFLAVDELASLRAALEERLGQGELRAAQVGAGSARQLWREVRGDAIAWLEPPLRAAEAALLGQLETLRLQLNRDLGLGLFEVEAHYAHYPPGARYVRHVDRPVNSADRIVTFVLYLNDAWAPASGGALRVYGDCGEFADILPLGGRMVVFLSAAREHEVLPATRGRLSVTGWFRRRGI